MVIDVATPISVLEDIDTSLPECDPLGRMYDLLALVPTWMAWLKWAFIPLQEPVNGFAVIVTSVDRSSWIVELAQRLAVFGIPGFSLVKTPAGVVQWPRQLLP